MKRFVEVSLFLFGVTVGAVVAVSWAIYSTLKGSDF